MLSALFAILFSFMTGLLPLGPAPAPTLPPAAEEGVNDAATEARPAPAPAPASVPEPVPAPLVDVDDVDEAPATDSPMCVPSMPEHVPAFPGCWWNPDDGPEPV
jgi:hypothetical protein